MAREFFRAEHGREPVDARELTGQIAKDSRPRTQTVAGYDLTFSPVKSVSTLWAVADPAVAAVIEQAHQAAVKDALTFIEKHALFTRTGPQGIRQVNVRAWWRLRSPTGTAGPATPICIPTWRSQTRCRPSTGGGCRSTGGCCSRPTSRRRRPTTPPSSSTCVRPWGCGSLERPGTDPAKRPIREIVGVDPRLNQRWSTRRAHINIRRGELADPVPGTIMAGHRPRSKRCTWPSRRHWRPATPNTNPDPCRTTRHLAQRSGSVLGGRDAVASMVRTALAPPLRAATSPTPAGSRRRPITCWPSWRKAGRPGRRGTSAPKHNARSASSTYPPNRRRVRGPAGR